VTVQIFDLNLSQATCWRGWLMLAAGSFSFIGVG